MNNIVKNTKIIELPEGIENDSRSQFPTSVFHRSSLPLVCPAITSTHH